MAESGFDSWNLAVLIINILLWLGNIFFNYFKEKNSQKDRDFLRKMKLNKESALKCKVVASNPIIIWLKNESEYQIDNVITKINIYQKDSDSINFRYEWNLLDYSLDSNQEISKDIPDIRDKLVEKRYMKMDSIPIFVTDEDTGEEIDLSDNFYRIINEFDLILELEISFKISKEQMNLKKYYFIDYQKEIFDDGRPYGYLHEHEEGYTQKIREFAGQMREITEETTE